MLGTYVAFGIFGGFIAGLLGIGGGIIMAPILLFLPPILGLPELSMKTVAGLTITQALAASLVGALVHKKYKHYNSRLVWTMGPVIFVAALAGGVASNWLPNRLLLLIFACMALGAAGLMFLPKSAEDGPPDQKIVFSKIGAAGIAGTVGLLSGLVGQGGAYLLIPSMLYLLHIPTRTAIASNLAIVLMSSLAAFIGKIGTFQVPLAGAAALVIGIIPGAQLGAMASQRVDVRTLRSVLALIISAAAFRIWIKVLAF